MERFRERTGIYGLGFRKESVMGLIFPVLFIILIGGLGAVLTLILR
jgi:hypothetical protein